MATGEATAIKTGVDESAELAERRRDEQRRERAKREREKAALGGLWSRRDVLGRLGWTLFGGFSLVTLLAAVRSAFPRVLFLPPSTFKAGSPKDYAIGEVSEKYKKDYRVWIVREEEGFYALWAKCTHLGCTTAAVSTAAGSTSRGRRRVPWSGSRSRSPTTVRSSSTRASSFCSRRASGGSRARS
jgi:hypothetical protein